VTFPATAVSVGAVGTSFKLKKSIDEYGFLSFARKTRLESTPKSLKNFIAEKKLFEFQIPKACTKNSPFFLKSVIFNIGAARGGPRGQAPKILGIFCHFVL